MSSSNANPLWFVSKRYKKKPQPLKELGEDIADDDKLIGYRPAQTPDSAISVDYDSQKKDTKSKRKTLEIQPPKVTEMSSSTTDATKINRCHCCRVALTRKDKSGISFAFARCKECNYKICRNCLEKNRCHECTIHEEIKNKLIPDMLLKFERQKLLNYIERLHYPLDHFKNCEDKYLVKQILVRFGAGNDWDPKFHNITIDTTLENVEVRKKSYQENVQSNFVRDSRGNGNHQVDGVSLSSDVNAYIEAEVERRLNNKQDEISQADSYLEDTRLNSPYGPIGYNTRISGQMQSSITSALREQLEDKKRRQDAWSSHQTDSFNLFDVSSPAYFENLSVPELKTILKQYSVPFENYVERHELKFAVLRLWNELRAQPAAVKSNFTPIQQTQQIEVKSLHDIQSVNLLEDFSTRELKELMNVHGRNVQQNITRQDLLHELKGIWQNLQQQQNNSQHLARALSLSDIKSASDIEKLTVNQLQELLLNNDINPRQYPQVHEMKYMIRQLWYRSQRKDESDIPQEVQRANNFRPNVHNRSMEETFDDRFRASTRRPNLMNSKSMNQLNNLDDIQPQKSFNPFSKGPASRYTTINQRNNSTDTSDSGFQPQQRNQFSKHASMPVLAVSLEDIHHPEEIQELNVPQLKTILSSRRVPFSNIADKAEMVWKVKELWMSKRARESELERRSAYTEPYNNSAFVPVSHQSPINQHAPKVYDMSQGNQVIQRVVSLQDIRRPEEIATLSRPQMKTLLERYKIHVPNPNDKASLMELTRRLWIQRNGETVASYLGAEQQNNTFSNNSTTVNQNPVYAKIVPAAIRKSFRSEEQLHQMEQQNIISLEPEVIHNNPVKLVEVNLGETGVVQRHNRNSAVWREEEPVRTSSPIRPLPAPTQSSINDLIEEIAAIQSLEDIRSANIIPRLSIKQMKFILSKHSVDYAGCSEKKEFEIHLQYLWKKNRNNKYPNY